MTKWYIMSETNLIELAYVSRTSGKITSEQLIQLLNVSRTYNRVHDITGILLFKDGSFLQVLEGPIDMVMPLYKKIEQDLRHTCVKTLYEKPLLKRNFAEWSMMYHDLSDMEGKPNQLSNNQPQGLLAFDHLEQDLYKLIKPSTARILVESFRHHA